MDMDFDWIYFSKLFVNADLLKASITVIELSILVWVLGVVLGLLMALANQSKIKSLRFLSSLYIWFFRSIPLLVLLVFLFALPSLSNSLKPIFSSPFITAVIGMTLSEIAYIAEIHRGGLLSINKGQKEAGVALGMRYAGIQKLIVIPQAIRISLPTLVNEYITIVKLTSLASVISLTEILLIGQRMYISNFKTLETLLGVACFYIAIVTVFDLLMKAFERKMNIERREPGIIDGDLLKDIRQGIIQNNINEKVKEIHKAGEHALSVNKINKSYGTHHVLNDISFDVDWGEVVSIIGPSGSGKTTLIRTLNGLESLDSGSVKLLDNPFLDGKELTAESATYNHQIVNIGMVFQSFNLFPHKTVLENVMLAPKYHDQADKEIMELTAYAMLDKVGMIEHANKYPHQLSGGQKQRVAIARTLAMKPSVILFDEPTSALDPQLVSEVLKVIETLTKEGLTMIIVTHEMDFAFNVSDKIIFMEHGDIIFNGSPSDLQSTTNHRLKNFIN